MAFVFWRQEDAASSANYSLFGKLPQRADFVRVNATIPVAREYDQLLASAVTALARDAGWEVAYDAAYPIVFAYLSHGHKSWFIGGQCSSHDQDGRRFPLVAGLVRESADIGNSLRLLPLAYEVFYSSILGHLQNAIENSVDAIGCRSFLESFSGMSNRLDGDYKLANALLNQFAERCESAYLQTILRSAYPRADLDQAILNIAFYANFLRHFPSDVTAQEIVLPLPDDSGVAALVASTWLTLVGNLAGDARRIIGFFFRDNFIVIALDILSKTFSPLFTFSGSVKLSGLMLSSEHEVWTSHPHYPEVSYLMARLVADPKTSLQSVLECARQVGNRLAYSELVY